MGAVLAGKRRQRKPQTDDGIAADCPLVPTRSTTSSIGINPISLPPITGGSQSFASTQIKEMVISY